MLFSTRHVSELYNVTATTVKNWCDIFAPFLSETARPPKGNHRAFTSDDLKVFSLVKSSKDHDSAYLALSNNERGELPPAYGEFSLTVDSREQIILYQSRIENLTAEIERLQDADRRALKAEAIADELRSQLASAHAEIARLNRELGAK